jgi:hypothetical protein
MGAALTFGGGSGEAGECGGGSGAADIWNRNAFLYAIVALFTPAVPLSAHEARMYSLALCAVTDGA